MKSFLTVSLTTSLFLLLGCNGGKNQTNIELIQDMMDQVSVKSQDWDPSRKDESTMMLPPEGTVPRGQPPYKYQNDPLAAEKNLVNPLKGDRSPEVISTGKEHYTAYCALCHGTTGQGDGQIAEKMAVKPPTLLSDKVKNFSDGRIFHIITAGQGVMGAYVHQLKNEEDRWKVVNYIRSLQDAN